MSTYTASEAEQSGILTAVYKGTNTRAGRFSVAGTAATAETIYLCKIPHLANITDVKMKVTTTATDMSALVGMEDEITAFGTIATDTAFLSVNVANLPYHISVSDTTETRYKKLTATVTPVSADGDIVVNWVVSYYMD